MTADYDYIERFFDGTVSPDEAITFEKRVAEDPSFAETVAFYLTAIRAAADIATVERKQRFRSFYAPGAPVVAVRPAAIRRFAPWLAAAAAIAAVVVALFIFLPSTPPGQLADNYITAHLATMPTTMDAHTDAMSAGVELYNRGKYANALAQFEKAMQADALDPKAKENAGKAALQLGQYDKALTYFTALENDKALYANPGKFYHALTLMKRNHSGDPDEAKKLLQDVVNDHLDLDKEAADLLKKL